MLMAQYFVLLIVAIVLIKSILNLSKRKITIATFVFIVILLDALLVVVFMPNVVNSLSNFFGIERAKDFMIYGAIAILFYFLFRVYMKIELIDREISNLVKKISLKQLEKEWKF